ncbi:RDD family protein [Micromonospora sp. RL09-050-HVF-A]|uniref:RDD family protein n=1 Tax=Micromonospora sp. RL09-050-HVF-A TaxID=1703433 RepID=UPI001C5E40F7|nr:RDD family protein [Micromonospora sp. RL09-050-HVF-A]
MTSSPAAPVPPATDPAFTPPTLGRRFGALVIDWVLCLLVANFFADPVRDGWAPVAVLIVEYGLFLGLFAQTPGMRITRLRCLDWSDGGRIGVPRALLRGLLLALVVPPLIMDEQRRGLHDRLTGAVIADAPRPTT